MIKKGIIKSNKGVESKKKGKPFDGDKEKLSKSLKIVWDNQDKRNLESLAKGSKIFNVYEVKSIIKGNRWGKGYVEKGNLLETHHNISFISSKYLVERNHIRRCLSGNLLQIKNKIFEYENNTN